MNLTLPCMILVAALVYAASYLRWLHVQADRENAAAELIAMVKRMEHRRRLEQAGVQSPGRHARRDTAALPPVS